MDDRMAIISCLHNTQFDLYMAWSKQSFLVVYHSRSDILSIFHRIHTETP